MENSGMKDVSAESFGCARCWPADADECYLSLPELVREISLIEESHFGVSIRSCGHCRQLFLAVFCETIDWADGEDPQFWTLLPITRDESSALSQRGSALSEAELSAVGTGRRSLRRDWPKGTPPRTYWATGLSIQAHD